MAEGKPFIPQHEQQRRRVQGPWTKYLKYLDGDEPAKIAILSTFRDFELTGVEITDESASIAVKLGRLRYQRNMEERAELERRQAAEAAERQRFQKLLDDHPDGVVYYVRRGDFIKIGTTSRYRSRMQSLMPDEVLAVEPGSYTLEHQRHVQFADDRHGRFSEYFRPSDSLKEHILDLRREHGVPDQSFITVTDGKRIFGDTDTG